MEIAHCCLCITPLSSCAEVRYWWELRLNSAHNFDLLILGRCGTGRVESQLSKYEESTVALGAGSENSSIAALKTSFIFTYKKMLISIELKYNSWKIIKESISTGCFWLIFFPPFMAPKGTETSQRGDDQRWHFPLSELLLKEKENSSMVLGGWRTGLCSGLCLNLNI